MQTTGDGKKLRILIVDDEPDLTAVLKIGLEKEGFVVHAFNSPAQAISQFKPGKYDIVITDIRMPGMSGFELARRIWDADADIPICLMSAFEILENEARKVFPTLKNYCFIKKPIMPSALVKHIQAHFATK